MLPPGIAPISGAKVRPDVPKQPKRQWAATPLKIIANNGATVLLELAFRRGCAPTQLRTWTVRPGSLRQGLRSRWNHGLPRGQKLKFPLFVGVSDIALPITDTRADELGMGPLANFMAAYIDNAFSEEQETWIELKAGGQHLKQGIVGSGEALPIRNSLHPLAKDTQKQWWLETSFFLPFINRGGTEPRPEDHPQLVLPMIRRKQLRNIRAWIIGLPLPVTQYNYPRNPKLGCFHSDLMDSGARGQQKNRLVIFLEC